MQFSRRDLCTLIPAALVPGALAIQALTAAAQGTATESAPAALIASGSYPWDSLVPKANPNGTATTRAIFKGKLATGESVEVHETTLAVGGNPHPPHHHLHSEMWLVREGTIEIVVNGKSYQISAGGAGFAASNEEHGVKNAGDTPATYFVVAIGATAL
jgi:mannose-6-phosphate isomerase-like protein (cupin superfamily)